MFCFNIHLWSQCNLSINIPSDITVCEENTTILDGNVIGNYISTTWEGTNGFFSDQVSATDFTTNTTEYTFTAYAVTDNNLVTNGDFEDGDQDFTSDYGLGEIICAGNPWGILGCEGAYTINTNPSNTHSNFDNCGDHTSGNGNMMIINGSSLPVNVWCQDINITPNTDYYFSAWAMSVENGSPANLQFKINGNLIGTNLNLTNQTCIWQNFTATYNSGSNSTATICVSNLNTAVSGNDFAIDDIEFLEVCKVEDSFTVLFSEPPGNLPTSHFIDCSNPAAHLEIIPAFPTSTYEWESFFGGEINGSDNIPGVIATSPGLYQVTITDINGCTKELSTTVNGSTQAPESMVVGEFIINCDNNMVTVFSTNTNSGNIYNWVGSSNNSTSTSAEYDEAGTFLLEITNSFHCTSLIFFDITEEITEPTYLLDAGETLNCIGDSTILRFETEDTPDDFTWYDPQGNPISNQDSITVYDIGYYSVLLEYDNGCTFTDSVQVMSLASELDYILGESPTITCQDSLSTLEIIINSPYDQINWFQDSIFSNNETAIVNTGGLYIVEVIDINGCITRDSVNITLLDYTPEYQIEIHEIDCITGAGSLVLSSDSTITATWKNQQGDIFSGDSINQSFPGEYYLAVENSIGCQSLDTLYLPANQDFPSIESMSQNLNCAHTEGIITVYSNIENTNFEWTGPSGFTSTMDSFSVNQPGNYIYSATTDQGCITTDTITILGDFTEPAINLGTTDTLTCLQNEIIIDISSDGIFTIENVETNSLINQSENSVTIGESGSTFITIAGENGCITTEEIITYSNFSVPDSLSIPALTLNCFNPDSLYTLDVTNNISTAWYDEMGQELSSTEELLLETDGDYSIVQTDQSTGCETTSFFTVNSDFTAEQLVVDYNSINCIDNISTIVLSSNQDIIQVQNIDNTFMLGMTTFETENAGTYNYIVTYSNGCTAENYATIEIDTLSPIISAEDKVFSCISDELTLLVEYNIDKSNAAFEWSGPDSNMSDDDFLITTLTGTFNVTVTNTVNGCFSVEDILVTEDSTNFDIEFDVTQPLCYGEMGEISLDNILGGTAPYDIIIHDENNSLFSIDETLPPGNFQLILSDYLGCDTSINFEIDELLPFSVSTANTISIAPGEQAELLATTDLKEDEINAISWTPAEFLNCSDCLNPTITYLNEDTWFTIAIEDMNGCVEIDSILVRIVINYDFYLSNTFTPNDDGNNDIFYIQSNNFGEQSVVGIFIIYDRWGNKVHEAYDFHPNDKSTGWNGTFQHKKASTGVYAYYAKILLPNGSSQDFKGNVTVMK